MLDALIARHRILENKINDAVSDNFGYAVNAIWFDELVDKRNELGKLIERAKGKSISEVLGEKK
jgi:hypothetical protein